MLVTRSRLHCVKFKLEFDKLMKEMNLPYGCLVGFSGTVFDQDTNQEYSESSMNGFPDRLTQENFKDPKFRILIVNNKFQTGFDEPLLHTMYVDKKLSGLQCVQTLSRLNRTMVGKTNTFVLDFVNNSKIIQDSFQPYYQGTILSEETDPNKLYSLEQEIKKYNLFTDEDINHFVEIFYDDRIPQEELQGVLDSVVEEWKKLKEEDREEFRHQIQSFIRLYGYISQIITFKDINLEKLYIFVRFLNKKLPKRPKEKLSDILSSVDLEYFRIEKKHSTQISLENEDGILDPFSSEVGGTLTEEPTELLSRIIQVLNDSFGSNLIDDDKVKLQKIHKRMEENEELRKVNLSDNTETNKRHYYDKIFDQELLNLVKTDLDFYKNVSEPKRNMFIKNLMFEYYQSKLMNTGLSGQNTFSNPTL